MAGSNRIDSLEDARIWIVTHDVEQRAQWDRQNELNARIDAGIGRIEARMADVEKRIRDMEDVQTTVVAIHREVVAMRDEVSSGGGSKAKAAAYTAGGGAGLIAVWELVKYILEGIR